MLPWQNFDTIQVFVIFMGAYFPIPLPITETCFCSTEARFSYIVRDSLLQKKER